MGSSTLGSSELLEKAIDYLEGLYLTQAQAGAFEHGDELFAVHQFDWRHAVSDGFLTGIACEYTRRQNETLVGAALHRAAKVAHLARRDGPIAVPLALE